MAISVLLFLEVIILTLHCFKDVAGDCTINQVIRGSWYSFEKGENTFLEIGATDMTGVGECVDTNVTTVDNVDYLFKDHGRNCYTCVHFFVRTVNIMERAQTVCQNFPNRTPSLKEACRKLDTQHSLITMFNENYIAQNCRSALEGVWSFGYRYSFSFTGECYEEESRITSCQDAGDQFLITNQKFTIYYKKCEGIRESFDGVNEFACLGDWFIGKNHYFAVANTKESRKDEKYRCFIRNRDDDVYMGHSITPDCQVLKTPENSPIVFQMKPVKHEVVKAGCLLPQNFTGEWVNTAHTEADIVINQTHIIEITRPDIGRERKGIFVCQEQKGNKFMMARLNIDGCQTDYACFEFIPRHHNIIRYRKGREMRRPIFSEVCNVVQFKSNREWNYDLFLAKSPVPIKCPVAGKFNFTQMGDEELLFKTRLLGGVTDTPWDNYICRENISDFSVCDEDQKEIQIDANLCITVDAYGRELDIYTEPDFKLKCIGYWMENLRSYLITYDEIDPFSKYRCWVYQRSDLNKIMMSQSVGPSCNTEQTVFSTERQGAAVSLRMEEYEREHDRCPMHFDDGRDPWKHPGHSIHVFDFKRRSGAPCIQNTFWVLFLTFFLTLFVSNI